MLSALQTRLEAQVEELAGRLFQASDFARVMGSNTAPTGGVNAYLVPTGITAQPAQASGDLAGLHRQMIRRGFALVLLLQSTDRMGQRALGRIDGLLDDILAAVCGWAPEDALGVFELGRAGAVPTRHRGVLAYQIEFHLPDQLRIAT